MEGFGHRPKLDDGSVPTAGRAAQIFSESTYLENVALIDTALDCSATKISAGATSLTHLKRLTPRQCPVIYGQILIVAARASRRYRGDGAELFKKAECDESGALVYLSELDAQSTYE